MNRHRPPVGRRRARAAAVDGPEPAYPGDTRRPLPHGQHPALFRSATHGIVDYSEDVSSKDLYQAADEGFDSVESYIDARIAKEREWAELAAAGDVEDLETIMEEIKGLFPANCRFTNARLDVQMVSQDTGLIRVAPIPVCIIQKNWREF